MMHRPILFSAPMIQALLEGRKTMTRRVAKSWGVCPYGDKGDLLWARETFVLENTYDYHGDHAVPTDGRPVKKTEDPDGSFWLIPHYRASEPEPHIVGYKYDADDDRTRWTPCIFMPKWASRITLKITDVRIERLQDITETDAVAEGVTNDMGIVWQSGDDTNRGMFGELWESINGKDSWDVNPWVWAISFDVIKQNVLGYGEAA